MGNVTIRNGIGYASHGDMSVQFISLSAKIASTAAAEPFVPIKPTRPYDPMNVFPWSPWGTNNLLPQEMLKDIETTGVLSAILDAKARMTTCQGIIPAIIKNSGGQRVIDRIMDEAEVVDFLEQNNQFIQTYGWIRDSLAFGRPIGRIALNRKGDKIASFQRDDITETRLAKKDSRGRINNIWYSGQWEKVRGPLDEYVFSVPLLDVNNPSNALLSRMKGGDTAREFSITVPHVAWGRQYYPNGCWIPSYKWVKIAQSIPEMKAAMFENSTRIKLQVKILNTFWDNRFGTQWKAFTDEEKEKKQQEVYEEINNYLVGAKNAGKTLFTTMYRDRDGKTYSDIEIVSIEDTTKPGEYLPDSAAANSEIAIACNYNLTMNGGNQKNGLYSENQGGSNVREASTLTVIQGEKERQEVRYLMNIIKYFNGWDRTYPGMDFIIPGSILTTLDTGAGAKDIVAGNAKPSTNGTDKNNN